MNPPKLYTTNGARLQLAPDPNKKVLIAPFSVILAIDLNQRDTAKIN
jgi:hypothetical protein